MLGFSLLPSLEHFELYILSDGGHKSHVEVKMQSLYIDSKEMFFALVSVHFQISDFYFSSFCDVVVEHYTYVSIICCPNLKALLPE